MKVKIAYTVNLEDIPQEVSDLMTKAVEAAEDAADASRRIKGLLPVGTITIAEARKELDFVRRRMELADTVFSDCVGILEGYENALKQIEEKELQEEKNEIQDGWSCSCANRIL